MSDPYGLSEQAMTALIETSAVLGSTLELVELLQASVSSACEITGLQTGAIYLSDGEKVHLQSTEPPLPPDFPKEFLSAALIEHPHIAKCIESGELIKIDDVTTETLTPAESEVCEARGLKAVLYVPLRTETGIAGAFIVGATDGPSGLADVDIAQVRALASHISLAIANAKLHESLLRANVDLTRTYDEALSGWATALEMRDSVTGGHSIRVEELTIRLAAMLGIPSEQIEHVRRGVLLHDIGKMIVPDSVLMKAGPLSEDEWGIMRQHPQMARDFMADIDFLLPAIDIPYCHHERWDGTGYPQGLSGNEIPLAARIFAVVDVFDALTSNRPYRTAWSKEEAIQHIRNEAGSHFDPAVVDRFLIAVLD